MIVRFLQDYFVNDTTFQAGAKALVTREMAEALKKLGIVEIISEFNASTWQSLPVLRIETAINEAPEHAVIRKGR